MAPSPQTAELQTHEVETLLTQGWRYLDVRTVEEFTLGHVPGAYNVPFQVGGLAGLAANPDFERVAQAVVAAPPGWVLGCHSGSRSRQAALVLSRLGCGPLANHREGWDGCRDGFGRKTPGWSHSGLPSERSARSGRSYTELWACYR